MKKIILFMVLALVLVAGGLGAFAYAQGTHEPMTGQKPVGYGAYAEWTYPDGTDATMSSGFILTNPDGVSEITMSAYLYSPMMAQSCMRIHL